MGNSPCIFADLFLLASFPLFSSTPPLAISPNSHSPPLLFSPTPPLPCFPTVPCSPNGPRTRHFVITLLGAKLLREWRMRKDRFGPSEVKSWGWNNRTGLLRSRTGREAQEED